MPKVPMTPEQLLRWHNAQAQLHGVVDDDEMRRLTATAARAQQEIDALLALARRGSLR